MKALGTDTCADCGVEIQEFGDGRWGRRRVNIGEDEKETTTWDFCCRITYDTSHGEPYRVLSADYHHVDGQKQRHFKGPEMRR